MAEYISVKKSLFDKLQIIPTYKKGLIDNLLNRKKRTKVKENINPMEYE